MAEISDEQQKEAVKPLECSFDFECNSVNIKVGYNDLLLTVNEYKKLRKVFDSFFNIKGE